MLFLYCYNNYVVSPKIKYNRGEKKDTFSVQADFRGISMRIYPQMLICYDRYVILVTHLDGYYEQEFIHFKGRTGYVKKSNQDYSDKLRQYIRSAVLEKVNESQDEKTVKEVSRKFNIFISLIGGVQYENRMGNSVHEYCIIELNGLIKDYGCDGREIKNRLFENEVVLSDDLKVIDKSAEISKMVEVVSKEVIQLCERDGLSDI